MAQFRIFIVSCFVLTFSTFAQAELGIKNYMQSWSYLSNVTRATSPSNLTKEYYSSAKGRLPKIGVLTEINSISTLSWFVLSSLFCEDLINFDMKIKDENAGQRIAHGALTFSQSMEQVTEAQLSSLYERYAYLFWGRKISAGETAELKKLFVDLRSEATSGSEWAPVVIGVCTASLSSLEGFAH